MAAGERALNGRANQLARKSAGAQVSWRASQLARKPAGAGAVRGRRCTKADLHRTVKRSVCPGAVDTTCPLYKP